MADGLQRQAAPEDDRHQGGPQDVLRRSAKLNPNVKLITGVVCGVRIEDIADPLMKKIRYMDKLVDELAKGKKLESILRRPKS